MIFLQSRTDRTVCGALFNKKEEKNRNLTIWGHFPSETRPKKSLFLRFRKNWKEKMNKNFRVAALLDNIFLFYLTRGRE